MTVLTTTIQLSTIGLKLIILENELEQNRKTMRRLESDIADKQLRLNLLKLRQNDICLTFESARNLQMPIIPLYSSERPSCPTFNFRQPSEMGSP